ncbi:hypothetical protein [Cellulomonas hominis]
MSTTAGGWSAEMDRKLDEMRADPVAYFARARKQSRKSTPGKLLPSGKSSVGRVLGKTKHR